MKCPYRKLTVQSKIMDNLTKTEEYFEDCYKEECPFYIPANHTYGGALIPDYCRRAYIECFSGGDKK